MEKKTFSKKVPIILAIVWLVVSMGVLCYTMPRMIRAESWGANWDLQMLVFFAELAFSVIVMALIRIFSVKAQIRWLAILSKILLIFYSVVGGLCLIAFIVIKLIGL